MVRPAFFNTVGLTFLSAKKRAGQTFLCVILSAAKNLVAARGLAPRLGDSSLRSE